MKRTMIFLVLILLIALCLPVSAENKSRTSINRTSSQHTEIVIHDYSPEARRASQRQAQRARRNRELREQRAHQLKLARIRKTPARRTQQVARNSDTLESIEARRKRHQYKPPRFFNGGQATSFAFNPGFFGGGFGFGFNRGFIPRYRGGYRGRFRGRSRYRGCRPRVARYRGRGRRCR